MSAPATLLAPFSGAYAAEDVTFLLKPVRIRPTPVAEKEALIQSGRAHYSEMISEERRPDARYMDLFETAFAAGVDRIAGEIATLAATLAARVAAGRIAAPVALASLVRAGVPYGVLLRRELAARGVEVAHYGISIIRDRGLDAAAMAHIRARHADAGIVFVDGWTGKGAIAGELSRSWGALTGRAQVLAVLADPCGRAELSGGHEDWLIPSGILGANVSGLISRSILNPEVVGPGDFHGTMAVDHLADLDRSRAFVDAVTARAAPLRAAVRPAEPDPAVLARLRASAGATISALAEEAGTANLNRLKPGIAEATRAVLRRRPERVFLRDAADPDLAALVHLCRSDGVPMTEDPARTGPWRAVTLIARTT